MADTKIGSGFWAKLTALIVAVVEFIKVLFEKDNKGDN